MPFTRIYFDVAEDKLKSVRGAIEMDDLYTGDEIKQTLEDGLWTVEANFKGDDPEIPTGSGIPWMEIANKELDDWKTLGEAERTNKINEYLLTCNDKHPKDPWCSAFVNYCITQARLDGTNSAVAKSWADWKGGEQVNDYVPGCIVVFKRFDKQGKEVGGHVGFFVTKEGNDDPKILGGNQGTGGVTSLVHERKNVIAIRMPRDAVVQTGTSSVGEVGDDRKKVISGTFEQMAPGIMQQLMVDFPGLRDFHAAGILGNLGHESGGFKTMQEIKPTSGKGGYGWGQWTGPRRDNFNNWCKDKRLEPASYDANYGFLKHELQTTEKDAITAVLKTSSLEDAVRDFEIKFERAAPKTVNYESRNDYARRALNAYNSVRKGA